MYANLIRFLLSFQLISFADLELTCMTSNGHTMRMNVFVMWFDMYSDFRCILRSLLSVLNWWTAWQKLRIIGLKWNAAASERIPMISWNFSFPLAKTPIPDLIFPLQRCAYFKMVFILLMSHVVHYLRNVLKYFLPEMIFVVFVFMACISNLFNIFRFSDSRRIIVGLNVKNIKSKYSQRRPRFICFHSPFVNIFLHFAYLIELIKSFFIASCLLLCLSDAYIEWRFTIALLADAAISAFVSI
jgi:hypothetical protein